MSVAPPCTTTEELTAFARDIRVGSLQTIAHAGLGHVGGDFSAADVLAVLYGAILRVENMEGGGTCVTVELSREPRTA